MRGRLQHWAGLTVWLAGCFDRIGPVPALPPPPSVILTIDAEPEVRRETQTLRLSFASLEALPLAGEPVTVAGQSEDLTQFAFPKRFVLPEEVSTGDAAFWVEASALDAQGRVLTSARLITNALSGETLRPVLTLSEPCLDVICGPKSLSCSPEGQCRSAVRAAEDLPSEPWP